MGYLIPVALGIAAAGTLANAWIQWSGMKEGRKEARRVEGTQLGLYAGAEKTRKKERRGDVKFREKQLGVETDWRNFQKRQTFVDTVLGQMNRKPELANNFITANRGRQ